MTYGQSYALSLMKSILLDASLCAIQLYEKRGYSTVNYQKTAVENGSILVYIVMKKELSHIQAQSTTTESVFLPSPILVVAMLIQKLSLTITN